MVNSTIGTRELSDFLVELYQIVFTIGYFGATVIVAALPPHLSLTYGTMPIVALGFHVLVFVHLLILPFSLCCCFSMEPVLFFIVPTGPYSVLLNSQFDSGTMYRAYQWTSVLTCCPPQDRYEGLTQIFQGT